MQDEILTDLAKIADLKVISRTSVMQYKTGAAAQPARDRPTAWGRAPGRRQRATGANSVRVNAQLINARNDAHLWAQTYDRDLADVFAIQSEIAKAIADQLQAKLSPAEKSAIEQRPTSDIGAFELYSRANDLILNLASVPYRCAEYPCRDRIAQSSPGTRSLILRGAVSARICPRCACTPCASILPNSGRWQKPPSRRHSSCALMPEKHIRPARYHLYAAYRDYDGALAELDIVRSKMPNSPRVFELTGYIARRRGAHDQGVRNLQHAVELDPRNFSTLQQLALSYKLLHRYSEEIATLDRALSIKPDDPEAKGARGLAFFDWKADTQTLHQTIDEIRTKNPEAIKSVADVWFICALAEHDAAAAEAALGALGDGRLFGDQLDVF